MMKGKMNAMGSMSLAKMSWVIVLSSVLLAVLNRLLGGLIIPGADFISFRPQLVIPVLASLLIGPLAGGIISSLGNFLGDLLLGYGLDFFHYSLTNFLIGFVPGTIAWLGIRQIHKVNELVILLLFVFLGNAIALFLGFGAHVAINQGATLMFTLQTFYVPAVISNTYGLMLLVPPALVLTGYLRMNIETRTMSVFLFMSLVVLSVVFIAVFVSQQRSLNLLSEGTRLPEANAMFQEMVVRSFRYIGLALMLIVFMAGALGYFFSKRYLQPINRLGEAASQLKHGEWKENKQIAVGSADEEMKNLIELFNSMAEEVVRREARMSREIEQLKLNIDKKKEEKILGEITETDFFKQLEARSKELKKKKRN